MKIKHNILKSKLSAILLFLFLSMINSNKTNMKTELQSTKCGALCIECSELDTSQCNVCKSGVFQYNSSCYEKCPVGTYADQEWQVCRECDSDCPVCWGPRSDMCGARVGVTTSVVLLENEIKNYFVNRPFKQEDTLDWFNKLNLIFRKIKEMKLQNLVTFGIYGPSQLESFDIHLETLSPQDVYNSNKIEVQLPEGSFSRNDGVFIPIPSYLNDKMELINSHWIFIKGMWDGHNWVKTWFPKLPSFIQNKGEKTKIYFENGGYWIFESGKGWNWMISKKLKSGFVQSEELISDLNTIKFEMGDYNTKRLQQKIELKKMQVESNVKKFFDKFAQTNKLIFSKLIDTVNNEENDLVGSLDDLKSRVKLYLGEEVILNQGGINQYPVSNVNLRKETSSRIKN